MNDTLKLDKLQNKLLIIQNRFLIARPLLTFALPLLVFSPLVAEEKQKVGEVEELGEGRYRIGLIEVDARKRTLTIPAVLNMREEVVEYLLVTEKGKTHESVLSTKATPARIHLAALLLGIKGPDPSARALDGYIEWQGNGVARKEPLHRLLQVGTGGETERVAFPQGAWVYTGSRETPEKGLSASGTGSIISLIDDPDALVNSTSETRSNDEVHFPAQKALPPKVQMPVRLVLIFAAPKEERK